ncbi:MAG TPA: molybdenum cofactor guanylyltransferase MobA [Alphaproteobacteria bacterium]|jgi:molybdopterin-guanine dinucleotide biosynthesis protein A
MVDSPAPFADTLGVVIAGGEARRMGGGDKCLLQVGGAAILAHILARLRPQVAEVLLNANGDASRFASYGLKVISDGHSGHEGPAAGLLAGLTQAAESGYAFCLTVPGDAPLLPHDLATRLREALQSRSEMCAVATSGGKRQTVFALWRTAALPDLRAAYASSERALWRLQDSVGAVEVPFAGNSFAGVNRPEDLTALAGAFAGMKP